MRVNYVIIMVSDMKRSVAFYRDVVGMPLKFETPEWTEFATDGATWALHNANEPNPDAHKPGMVQAGRCHPGFNVPSVDEFHDKMTSAGVTCVREPTNVFGSRVAQYADPDGLVFGVGEERKS